MMESIRWSSNTLEDLRFISCTKHRLFSDNHLSPVLGVHKSTPNQYFPNFPCQGGDFLLLICSIMLCSEFRDRWVQVLSLSCIMLFSSMQLWLPLFPPIWLPIEICKYHIFYQLYLSCQRSNMLVYATWLQTIFDLLLVLFMLVRAGQNSKISTFSLLSAGTPLFAYSKEC